MVGQRFDVQISEEGTMLTTKATLKITAGDKCGIKKIGVEAIAIDSSKKKMQLLQINVKELGVVLNIYDL